MQNFTLSSNHSMQRFWLLMTHNFDRKHTKLPFSLANESHQQLKPFRESKVCFDATKMVENMGTVRKEGSIDRGD
jgi:hypothetical protein